MANHARIESLKSDIENACAAMEAELEKAFPMGKPVRCWLMHGQATPSTGIVIGYTGGRHAYVRILLDSRTRATRDIPASNVRLLSPSDASGE